MGARRAAVLNAHTTYRLAIGTYISEDGIFSASL